MSQAKRHPWRALAAIPCIIFALLFTALFGIVAGGPVWGGWPEHLSKYCIAAVCAMISICCYIGVVAAIFAAVIPETGDSND